MESDKIREILYDFDVSHSRVVATPRLALLDNVSGVVMITETSITVRNGKSFTSVIGSQFLIKEIEDGKMLINGNIQRVEFYDSLSNSKD